MKESNRKPNKIWVDIGIEFYSRSMKSFLQNNNIEMYSTHNEGKPIVTEIFIRTLKNKIYKYMTSVSQNVPRRHTTSLEHPFMGLFWSRRPRP